MVPPPTAETMQIISQSHGVGKDHVRTGVVTCGGVPHSALFEHPFPHDDIAVEYAVHKDAQRPFLFFRIGVDDSAINRRITDGVIFSIVRRVGKQSNVIFSRALNPVATPGDRGWTNAFIDLRKLPGDAGTIHLQLIVDPGPARNSADDHAAWADLQVLADQMEPAPPEAPLQLEQVYNKEIGIYRVPKILPRASVYYST
jgi:hypothetical protein